MQLIPVILCGGAGSRLWPVSREFHPKPFIRLADGQSFLQKAFLRAALIPGVSDIVTVTNRELYFKAQDDYREINTFGVRTSFILEPFGRNTAAAIAMAALYVAEHHGDDAVMMVLAADHLIADQGGFQLAVDKASQLAGEGKLVTFGIQPDAPETGYGYIEIEKEALSDGFRVCRFVEKPTQDTAQQYLDSGRYLWNSGMFCYTVGLVLNHMQQYCPVILSAAKTCFELSFLETMQHTTQFQLDAKTFADIPDQSFDYAVMEPASTDFFDSQPETSLAVVPASIGWRDIGSWVALGDLSTPDSQGNRIDGMTMLHDTTNCYVQSHERMVGVVGCDQLIIVDTPDALLVANKSHAQEVKQVYSALKLDGHDVYKRHRTVHRPWGTYTVLEEGERFKIKRIVVKPGASLSLQMHHHRSEHWIVVSGTARVMNGDMEQLIYTNQSTYIPAGNKHRLENPGLLNLVMIEVQSGEYLGEDDIIRFDDHYGRHEVGEVKA